jgi:hypothetical protein
LENSVAAPRHFLCSFASMQKIDAAPAQQKGCADSKIAQCNWHPHTGAKTRKRKTWRKMFFF